MNGSFPYTSSWIGSLGEYPIYEYIKNSESTSSNFTINTSNILESYSSNYTSNTSNIFQTQISNTSKLIYKDNSSNTIINITAKNQYYPIYGDAIELYFKPLEGNSITKINQNGELMVYHPAAPLPAGFSPGWWGVENKIAVLLTDTEGLRFDVTNLQVATGATAITETSTATAAAVGTTAAAGATIAQGDYGTVALGVAGGALFSVLGYLSYQAQVESNLTSNGFTTQAATVHSNINIANVLLTENINNIVLAKGFINSNILYAHKYVSSNNLSNLNINYGFINSNITTQQYIPSLKVNNLYLNNGNISNINGISVNEIIASGKIKQNNQLLDNIYLTSNHLYNLSYNYSSERQYPSKLYTTTQSEDIVSLLGKLVYRNILYLDNSSISYGSGFYEIYSSSTYDTPTTKDKLFNFNTTETTNTPRWGISLYTSGTGNYAGDNSIDNVYYGDWVIIKMPQPIMLTRYRIYRNTLFTERAPAEWKVYGSNDGITFTEITEASQITRLLSLNYTYNYYDKTLATTFTTQYQYFGFVFNKLLSTAGETTLNFAELQLFGKEILSNTINSYKYTSSNAVKGIVEFDMPVLAKHKGIKCGIATAISINGTNYYKYDLDLRNFTSLGTMTGNFAGDTYRIFKINVCLYSMYFSYLVSSMPDVIQYDVWMSYKQNPSGLNGIPDGKGAAGLNCVAVGVPVNYLLDTIPPNNIFLLKNGSGDINYITLMARQPTSVNVIIEDKIA